jgi:hypothetical protein
MHWLWWFWIISSVASFTISRICMRAMRDTLIQEGYIVPKKKSTFAQVVKTNLYYVIPLYNIIVALVAMFCTKMIKREMIIRCDLKKPEESHE